VIPRHFPGQVVKLRSFGVRNGSRDAVDSLVHYMVRQHFNTGIVAPTPSTAFPTASRKDGANESCFHVTSLFQATIFSVRNASRGGSRQSCSSHGIASLCYWICCSMSQQGVLRRFLKTWSKRVVFPLEFLVVKLRSFRCAMRRLWAVFSITWYRITLPMKVSLQLPKTAFASTIKGRANIP
jgi:hypothetical protein